MLDNHVDWLTNEVIPHERALDRVRAAVYARCREQLNGMPDIAGLES